jgi:DNA-binding transcriptional LysR family regulator
MNSRHLDTLLCVMRLGGIGAAARHLNLTQPTVTRRIQELERELGTELFQRDGRRVVATASARLCVANAERILAEVAAMRVAASGLASVGGTVRAGVVELVALSWFDRLLLRVGEIYPKIAFEIDVDLSSRLVTKLARRELDIIFVPGAIPVPRAVSVDLGACCFRWMASPSRVPAGMSSSPEDISELPIITLPHEADVHENMIRWFEAAGLTPSRLSFCNSFSVVASLVRKGLGVSLLPSNFFADDLSRGTLVALSTGPVVPTSRYSAAYLPVANLAVLPQIASLAREESWFLTPDDPRWRNGSAIT